jgi:NAD(P)-dependent dehydrogenase (short-subunit alcohol dehydrogenase family)
MAKHDNWTTENIKDLSGKIIIVTGGNSGLGFESVKAFAEKGATVILASRDLQNGEAAKQETGMSQENIIVMQLDLQDFASIDQFAADFSSKYTRLDVLLNNAGIMTTPYFLTKDGLEGQMGTNHFGHFRLTSLLLPILSKTPASRIVNVSSAAHKAGRMDFENLQFEHGGYTPMKAYGRSKLSNLLFTYELQRKFNEQQLDVISVAAHPGASRTNLDRYLSNKLWFKLLKPVFMLISQDQVQGALPQIRASVDEHVKGAEYYGPSNGMKGLPIKVTSNRSSHDANDAKELWDQSEQITQTKFVI